MKNRLVTEIETSHFSQEKGVLSYCQDKVELGVSIKQLSEKRSSKQQHRKCHSQEEGTWPPAQAPGETLSSPCQNPASWQQEALKNMVCEGHGMCWAPLPGWSCPSSQTGHEPGLSDIQPHGVEDSRWVCQVYRKGTGGRIQEAFPRLNAAHCGRSRRNRICQPI